MNTFHEARLTATITLMQPQDSNQYNFIMNSGQQAPRSGGPSFLQDPTKRIFVAIGFVIGVLMLLMIGLSILLSLGGQSQDKMIDAAAYQIEIIRISEIGLEEASGADTKAQLSTLLVATQSDLTNITEYLATSGVELSDTQSIRYQDPERDSAIASAAERNQQDEEVLSILADISAAYKGSLGTSLDDSPSPNQKALLEAAAANILIFENAL